MKKSTRSRKTMAEVIKEKLSKSNKVLWDKPWSHGKSLVNHFTGHEYSGINRLLLEEGEYGTFLQIKQSGNRLKKGSKGNVIFQYTPYLKKIENEEGEEEEIIRKYFKLINVFDVKDAGIEYKHKYVPHDWENDELLYEKVMGYINKLGVKLEFKENSSQAFYTPALDKITMPFIDQFKSKESFYSTLFHEVGHATGSNNRLNRLNFSYFGDEGYSEEELVAEIFSFGLMRDFGLSNFQSEENSAAYLKSWYKKLSEEPELLIKASRSAEKAFKVFYGLAEIEFEDFTRIGEERKLIEKEL